MPNPREDEIQLLKKARNIIEEQDHLGRRAFIDSSGCYCTVGAIRYADELYNDDVFRHKVFVSATRMVAEAMGVQIESDIHWMAKVYQINDKSSQNEILEYFDKAIAKAKGEKV